MNPEEYRRYIEGGDYEDESEIVSFKFDEHTMERIGKLMELYNDSFGKELSIQVNRKHNVSLLNLMRVIEDIESLQIELCIIIRDWFKKEEENYDRFKEYSQNINHEKSI